MTKPTYKELQGLVSGLQSFARRVQENAADKSLVSEAIEKFQILSQMDGVLNELFITDNINKSVMPSPSDEILRKPQIENLFSCTPSFIIGHARSGTTLLTALLNTSKNIAALPEAGFAGTIAALDNLYSYDAGHKLARTLEEPYARYMRRLGKLVDDIYSDYVKKHQKSRWVSKELFIPHRLDRLDAIFGYHSKFIYIVRHGFSVAHSCASRFLPRDSVPLHEDTSLSVECYLREWVRDSNATFQFYKRNKDRCLLVRYEELVKSPRSVTKSIYDFLDEPWFEGVIEQWGDNVIPQSGDNKINTTNGKIIDAPYQWLEWPKALIECLAEVANPTLERLGYDTVV